MIYTRFKPILFTITDTITTYYIITTTNKLLTTNYTYTYTILTTEREISSSQSQQLNQTRACYCGD